MKKIIFIPPNGTMFFNDFSIQRIGQYFYNNKNIHTTLIMICNNEVKDRFEYIDEIIEVESQEEIFEKLELLIFDIIFHRSWMLAYGFAGKLVEKYDNVIVNIKDWEVCSLEEYKFIFGEESGADFIGIESIFQKAKCILSHYTKEQGEFWAKKYNIDAKRFIFFPEYCNEDNLNYRVHESIERKIVLAASLAPSSYPEEMFPSKGILRAVKTITNLGIDVTYVLPPGTFNRTQAKHNKNSFLDVLYEDKFNPYFHIIKGVQLSSSILNDYQFGIFILEYTTKNILLDKYAVPSKFAFYLENGIPMLVNSNMKSLSEYIVKYNLGIVFNNQDIENFSEILDISSKEYSLMVENIQEFRKDKFLYSQQDIIELFFD